MKYTILFYLFFLNFLFASPEKKQLLSPTVTLQLLETIKRDAIVLGHGKTEIHTFIDPLCSMSRRYLSLLYKRSHTLFPKYTIYLHLNKLKSKNSKEHILTIMDSKLPEKTLRDIMLRKEMSSLRYRHTTNSRITLEQVKNISKKIGVYKYPYIIINGKVK